MPNGGFLVRFLNEKGEAQEHLCYEIKLSFDEWTFRLNNNTEERLPALSKIEVIPQAT